MLKREREIGSNVKGKRLAWTSSMVGRNDLKYGTSNYVIPIYTYLGACNPEIAMLLWFFDSRAGTLTVSQDGGDEQVLPVEDWVAPDVVRWFQLEKAAYKKQLHRSIPSLAFVHIPIQATRALQEKGINKVTTPGLDQEIIGHQANTCDADGNCKYNGKDSPFMDELFATEGLKAVFSGHDHGIDWCMQWFGNNESALIDTEDSSDANGIHLCFNRH